MTLFGNRVFTDDQVKMRSQPKVTGIHITALMTGGYLDTDTATQGECHMKREDWRDVSTSFLLPEGERAARNRLSLRRLRKNQLCPHLDFGLLASILRQCIYVVLSHLVCGTLLWHPPLTRKLIHYLYNLSSKTRQNSPPIPWHIRIGGSPWFPLMVFLVLIPLLSWYFPRYPCVRVGIIVWPAVCVHARVCVHVCVCVRVHMSTRSGAQSVWLFAIL